MESQLALQILPQPDDASCGPTCLHAVYTFYGDVYPLQQTIAEVQPLETGGTLAVHLAYHALARGYNATIFTYNLHLFDPTWFTSPPRDLAECLRLQAEAKADRKLRAATEAYLGFLERGGKIKFQELTPGLIRRYLKRNQPLLTGLSATYLYRCARERGENVLQADDIAGDPTGHFVVLSGYDPRRREVLVADPLQDNPPYQSHYYAVPIQRLIGAVLLGVLTYDANLLLLTPQRAA